jgi:tRNA (cytidine32/guanosine34-2'-O)-methyltransferase
MDEFVQSQLILAALTLVTHVLRPGGTFVAKIFRGKDIGLLYAQLKLFFPLVHVAKPKSSRNSSIEAFVVCRQYALPPGLRPEALRDELKRRHDEAGAGQQPTAGGEVGGSGGFEFSCQLEAELVPFLACGDLSGYDADQSYPLEAAPLEPVAPPTVPPYRTALSNAGRSIG